MNTSAPSVAQGPRGSASFRSVRSAESQAPPGPTESTFKLDSGLSDFFLGGVSWRLDLLLLEEGVCYDQCVSLAKLY